jgi:hypothetical protein
MVPWSKQHPQKLLPIHKLIAGNIYISTGGKSYESSTFLRKLLHAVQEECATIRRNHQDLQQEEHERTTIVLAHAFADPCYDRSSLHLAGTSGAVAQVSSLIARLALHYKSEETNNATNSYYGTTSSTQKTAHPYVGFVDHIALMPLLLPLNNDAVSLFLNNTNHRIDAQQQHHSCSQAAKSVGEYLTNVMGCVVHYYGSASIDHAPLSKVRRERTTFFQSGSLESSSVSSSPNSSSTSDTNKNRPIVVCVGSPFNFVENFNVRLSASTVVAKDAGIEMTSSDAFTNAAVGGKRAAMSLCRTLRERDGGLEGVEALTLPYHDSTSTTTAATTDHNTTTINSRCSSTSSSSSSWEVACNLLSPYNSTGVSRKEEIRHKTMEWLLHYNTNNPHMAIRIDKMYSVGTTQEQCFHCLRIVLMEEEAAIRTHDEAVLRHFLTCFQDTET